MPWHLRARDWQPQSAHERVFQVKDARQKATDEYHTWVRLQDRIHDRAKKKKNLLGACISDWCPTLTSHLRFKASCSLDS